MLNSPHFISENSAQWRAELQLGFQFQHNRTVMVHRKHSGPIRVQKMFWPEKTGVCHAIIVYPPAGMTGGDQVNIEISTKNQSHAVITTPGAGKWYQSRNGWAEQNIHIQVQDGAIIEWLPQETMLFNGAYARNVSKIDLSAQAGFIGWDMLMIGRSACAEQFEQGQYYNRFELWREQQLLIFDQLTFTGQDPFLQSCLGMHGQAVMGNFWAVPPQSQPLEQQLLLIRELLMQMDTPCTVSEVQGVLCGRFLGQDARQCHDAFAAIRARLRRYWFDLDEEFPRIWRT